MIDNVIRANSNEIHRAIWDWLYEENADNGISELSFISAQYDENGSMVSDSRVVYTPIATGISTLLIPMLMGTGIMQYDFMLKQYAPITYQTNNPKNISILGIFENLAEWVVNQKLKNNLPTLPKNCEYMDLTVNPGTIAGVDPTGAMFQMTINLKYYYKGELT